MTIVNHPTVHGQGAFTSRPTTRQESPIDSGNNAQVTGTRAESLARPLLNGDKPRLSHDSSIAFRMMQRNRT